MLSIAQAADRLGISPAAVRALVRAGRLRHYRPTLGGRRVVIAEADVAAHLEASQRQGIAVDIPLSRVSLDPSVRPFGRR